MDAALEHLLRVQFRLTGQNDRKWGNSGIQYRSKTGIQWRAYAGPAGVYNNDWMLTGPQFDYWSGDSAHTGQAYSENTPMGIEASRNEIVRQYGNLRARKNLVGTIATTDVIAAALNPEGTWNHFEIIARGPVVMHFINGQLTAVLVESPLSVAGSTVLMPRL